MTRVRIPVGLVLILAAGFVWVSGCQIPEDATVASIRSKLKLSAKPDSVSKIGDAQSAVTESEQRVTIVGKADLSALPSGEKPKAIMLVREIIEDDAHGHGSDHDASSCAFCRRRQEQAPKAAVEFVGDDGKVLPYTIEKLFGIANGEEVVVTGLATMDANAEMLKVTANGLFFSDPNNN